MNNPFLTAQLTRRERGRFALMAKNWSTLYLHLPSLSEEELAKMVHWELQNKRRTHILTRSIARFNSLRVTRERQEIFDESFRKAS